MVDGLEEDVVDYGTVGTGENRTKLLKIFNNNPIEVILDESSILTTLNNNYYNCNMCLSYPCLAYILYQMHFFVNSTKC